MAIDTDTVRVWMRGTPREAMKATTPSILQDTVIEMADRIDDLHKQLAEAEARAEEQTKAVKAWMGTVAKGEKNAGKLQRKLRRRVVRIAELKAAHKADISDMRMLMDHLGETYTHFSGGRISKPNTFPSEVIAVAEELEEERAQKRGARIAELEGVLRELVGHAGPHWPDIDTGDLGDRVRRLLDGNPAQGSDGPSEGES